MATKELNMNKLTTAFFTCLIFFTSSVLAKGSIGLGAEVSVDGFFSPEVVSFKVNSVEANSAAAKAGIKVGQQVLAIDGCQIPGCPASKAKKLMNRNAGETLPLLVKHADGSESLIKILVE